MVITKLLTNTVLLSLLPTTALASSPKVSVSIATPGEDDVMPSFMADEFEGGLYPGGGGGILGSEGAVSAVELVVEGSLSFSSETINTMLHVTILLFMCTYNYKVDGLHIM